MFNSVDHRPDMRPIMMLRFLIWPILASKTMILGLKTPISRILIDRYQYDNSARPQDVLNYYFLIKTSPDKFGFEIEKIDGRTGVHLISRSKVLE